MDDNMMARFAGNFKQGKDGAQSDVRSEFEKKAFSALPGKDVNKKEFATNSLNTDKKWDGKKDFATSSFAGSDKTNPMGSRNFATSEAREGAMAFAGADKEFKGKPSDISKDSWLGAKRTVETHEDKRTANTPNIEAPVYSFREYAKKTVEDTNAMLGRKVSE